MAGRSILPLSGLFFCFRANRSTLARTLLLVAT